MERMWKEAVVSHFKVLSQHFSRITEGNHRTYQLGWSVIGPRIEHNTYEYEELLMSTPQHSVRIVI